MRSVWQRLAQLIAQINAGSPASDEPCNALDLSDLVTVLEDLRSLARARPLKFGHQFLARAPLEESFMSVSATTPSPSSSLNYNFKGIRVSTLRSKVHGTHARTRKALFRFFFRPADIKRVRCFFGCGDCTRLLHEYSV